MTSDFTGNPKRAPFSTDLKEFRSQLVELIPILEAKPGWYSSVFFEKKSGKSFSANLKQTEVADTVSQGAVLRIYDGYTLFEQATDELGWDELKKSATELVERVRATPAPQGATRREYPAATWKDRLSSKLEDEIRTQVPKDVKASTPVHFGICYKKDPKALSAGQYLDHLKGILARVQTLAPKAGLKNEDLTFVSARQSFSEEESIFIDRETNMSQTLYRMAMAVVAMSGAERVFVRPGGLGGLETVEVSDDEILSMLRDLKALKEAERLIPGRYRVVFGPVLTGVLAHEAFGHAQEGDTCARERSKAWEFHKTGEKVGNDQATILNNPAIFEMADQTYAAWGSYFFDEEGWLAQEQILLDKGVLKTPMTNLTSALRLGVPRTANGKRESWANGVYTRQTNTYFSPGDRTLGQLMAELEDGFIALQPAGGMEDPKGMGIQVGISFLQEVKGGKLTGRVFRGPAGGDIQLTGYTPDVLNSIIAKSKIEAETSAPDRGRHPHNDAGGCGKYHKEFVYAGCGGPYMLLDRVILG